MQIKSTFSVLIFSLIIGFQLNAQHPNHFSDWSKVGNYKQINKSNKVYINDFGSNNNGNKSNNDAFNKALNALNGKGGIIQFGRGTYLFNSGLSIPSNVHLKGEGPNTNLAFELSSEQDAINFTGAIEVRKYKLAKSAFRTNTQIELKATDNLKVNDLIKISLSNSTLTTSDWAKGSVGQIVRITEIKGNTLSLENELRINFLLSDEPEIKKIIPVKNAGLSCLQVITKDSTASNGSIIKMQYAENCYLRNIITEYCNLAHVEIDNCYRIDIKGSFFRFAHSYKKGAKGLGILIRNTTSNCLIENNIFSFLIHSLVLEAGANGNVISYNYSTRTYWEKPNEASNNSADIWLNGNYPFANLLEGNVVQNIEFNSKNGINGPNTFYCNWAELFGFKMQSNSADSLNIIKTRITNNLPQFGKINRTGKGHYEYKTLIVNQLKYDSLPLFDTLSLYANDTAEFTLNDNEYKILAEERFSQNVYIDCGQYSETDDVKTDTLKVKYSETGIENTDDVLFEIYPNPSKGILNLKTKAANGFEFSILNSTGQLVFKAKSNSAENVFNVKHIEPGLYFLQFKTESGFSSKSTLVIAE